MAKKFRIEQRIDRNSEKLTTGVAVLKEVMLLMPRPKEHYAKASDEYRRTALQTYFHHIKVREEGSPIPATREPFVLVHQANDVSAVMPKELQIPQCPQNAQARFQPLRIFVWPSLIWPDEKTAQNAVFGGWGGSSGQKENDAENSAPPLYS